MRSLLVTLGYLTVATTCPAQTPNWVQIKPSTSPPARSRHAMIYDSARQRTVLFGGLLTGGNVVLGDTWEWNDGKWTKMTPAKSPSARLGHGMAYDSARRRTVLFRGNNTWEWDGTNWTKMSPANSPSARDFVAMAYDSVRQRTVLFGGRNGSSNFTDTWEWDGINWTKMTPVNSPPSRWGSAMVYDSARQRTVLFGGGRGVRILDRTAAA